MCNEFSFSLNVEPICLDNLTDSLFNLNTQDDIKNHIQNVYIYLYTKSYPLLSFMSNNFIQQAKYLFKIKNLEYIQRTQLYFYI